MELLCLLSACVLSVLGPSAEAETTVKLVKNEDEDVVLPCSFPLSVKDKVFDWKKGGVSVFYYDEGTIDNVKGSVFLFKDQLESGNASVVIRKAQVTDGGIYTCNFPNYTPMERAHIDLTVDPVLKPRNITGAARWPLTTLDITSKGILLRCGVIGAFPKPELRWLDSSGNVLLPDGEPEVFKRDHHWDVVLKTTVTESGYYSCEVTQREIYHRNHTQTYVPVPGPLVPPPEKSTGKITIGVAVGIVAVGVIGVVIGIIGVVAAVCFNHQRKKVLDAFNQGSNEGWLHPPPPTGYKDLQ